jgi:uncharacterized protein
MKVRLPHAPYIANKAAIDLLRSDFIRFTQGRESVAQIIQEIIEADIIKERELEQKVKDLLSSKEADIEFMQVDYKQLFWMAKKKLCDQEGFIINKEDRYSNLSHNIMNTLHAQKLIEFSVIENKVLNVIYNSIVDYIGSFESVEDEVFKKISHYKRELIPGTDEYDLLYKRLYEEELAKKGLM